MGSPPPKAVYADLLALPEDVKAEIIDGAIVTSPAALPRHGRAQGALGRFVGGPFDYDEHGPGGWWILLEADVQLGPHDVARPDLCGYRRERLRNPGNVRPLTVVPDWICEVLSPSTAQHDRVTKAELYARSGVAYYWLVDLEERVLEAFRLVNGQWLRVGAHSDEHTARIEPFELVELPVGRLFLPADE
jgi:Uma2 family endonuclease